MTETKSKQTTINKAVTLQGVGLHTGKEVTLTFRPAEAGNGYAFLLVQSTVNNVFVQPKVVSAEQYVGVRTALSHLNKL